MSVIKISIYVSCVFIIIVVTYLLFYKIQIKIFFYSQTFVITVVLFILVVNARKLNQIFILQFSIRLTCHIIVARNIVK